MGIRAQGALGGVNSNWGVGWVKVFFQFSVIVGKSFLGRCLDKDSAKQIDIIYKYHNLEVLLHVSFPFNPIIGVLADHGFPWL